ncbi:MULTISPECIES: ribosome maturation factor RimP [Protofrankia]|uniref:ribosome maturation factor RimP n=1 Tax=Protofrankia TaxID=2994361 RepID=UPI0009781422|nr:MULTISPECIES: ribosome maturation factor RimP [Protofrankia]ONH36546.1 ribosome maturation factor RimP [Protofrankia sp. BMG5.30]
MGDAVAATSAADAGGGRRRARTRPRSPDVRPSSARAELVRLLTPQLAARGFDLEDVTVSRAGSRSVVRVVVDRDGGVDLDAVAEASRVASAVLDAAETDPAAGGPPLAGPYVLEVSSPGVDRPLVAPRHWRRARGRLVSVRTRDGRQLLGRVRATDEQTAELVPEGGRTAVGEVIRISFADVVRAAVQVEFRATDEDLVTGDEDPAGDEHPAGDEVLAAGEAQDAEAQR